jgi:7-cyano-7-deazaguanine synthase in queuosine biosynthesis
MKKIAILWSGGVDSTSVLKQYLEKTTYEIIAIHVDYSYPNQDGRNMEEFKAVKMLLPELRKIRPFKFTQMDLCYRENLYSGDLILFSAPVFVQAASMGCKEIIIGFVKDIRFNQDFYVKNKLFAMNSICEVIAKFDKYKRMCRYKKPMQGIYNGKKNYIKELGGLLPLTHWCRNPSMIAEGEKGCGECMPCKHILRIFENEKIRIADVLPI